MSPLRHRMIEDMQIRNLTPNTQRVYVEQVGRFARHFRRSHFFSAHRHLHEP
jgi:integrase/recombinase XerD